MNKGPSFSQNIKEELCLEELSSPLRDKSLLSAFIRINGSLVFRDKITYLVLSSENIQIIRL